MEGPDRQRQHAGRQPHHPGAQHRGGDHRGRHRRSLEEDHRQRQGRDPSAEEHDQHDGRPALVLRGRGHARRPRSGHRGQARRPGQGQGRQRHVEGPDGQRQHACRQPHQPGTQHRRGDDCSREGRALQEDHRRRTRRDPRAQEHDQHHGRPALDLRSRGDARREGGGHRRKARRPGAGRRRLRRVEGPHGQREPTRRHADDAAARDLRGLSGGDAGRPDALDRGRGGGRGRGAQEHDQPDDREPRRDNPRQYGAGLAELEHGALHRHAPGRARPRNGLAADHVRADTARRGAARRVLHDGFARRRGRRFRAPPGLHLRLQAAQERPEQVQGRRGSRRPGRSRAEADPGHAGAGRLRPDQLGSRRRNADQPDRPPRALRGSGAGSDRARLVPALRQRPAGLPRAVVRVDRGRAEHDPGEHADGGAARTVAGTDAGAAEPVRRAAGAAGGAPADEQGARGAGGLAQGLGGAAADTAGGAATDERGTGREGAAARGAEPSHRDQEPRDRAGPCRSRREGRAALALVALQVRVPREHVTRAAHAAELAADPREAAGRELRCEPEREADRIREHDLRRGLGPARPDQRHPRPLEGRGRPDGRQRQRRQAVGPARLRRAFVQAGRGGQDPRLRDRGARRERAAGDRDRRAAAAAGDQEPALERVQVHGVGRRQAADRRGRRPPVRQRGAVTRRGRARVHRRGHRRRHRARQAPPDLRGLPAGGRDDEPPLRRDRPRALDQPRDRTAARRRDPRGERGWQRQHVHALPAGHLPACRASSRRRAERGSRGVPGRGERRQPTGIGHRAAASSIRLASCRATCGTTATTSRTATGSC